MPEFFAQTPLFEFSAQQLILTLLIFAWSGFVRSGLGFGGAALGLPLMLLVYDRPLFWLPVIGIQLLFFTSLTLYTRLRAVDWQYLRRSSWWIIPAKLVGVFGLINLPNSWLVIIIYAITLSYALLWTFNLQIRSQSGWTDKFLLMLGGYVSGTSLTGAPLIVAVYMQKLDVSKLRNTLFVLWFILVVIKLSTLAAFDVDLQLTTALLLIPAAAVGHVIGLRTHDYILRNDARFKRILGAVLALICLLGLSSIAQH